ncbi:MAG: zinc ribbon domain-containing protein [Clostridia bacterium]|nr:zinc ribbon domain-containing protein [Clostridia bacterium]
MFCRTCGKEINDDAIICPNCGCATNKKNTPVSTGESKKGMGLLLGFFLGLIGLIIGLCIYQPETEERKTFMSGWVTAFVISICISVVFGIIYGISLSSLLNYYY